jgi:predicted dehydrogenase
MAMANKICSEGFGFRTPDMVVALLKFEDGMVAKVSANFGCVFPHFHKLTVYGTTATFENDLPAARMSVLDAEKVVHIPVETSYPGLTKGDLIPGFIDTIRSQAKAAIEEDEVIATMDVCFAIDRSWREQKPIHLLTDSLVRRCA